MRLIHSLIEVVSGGGSRIVCSFFFLPGFLRTWQQFQSSYPACHERTVQGVAIGRKTLREALGRGEGTVVVL